MEVMPVISIQTMPMRPKNRWIPLNALGAGGLGNFMSETVIRTNHMSTVVSAKKLWKRIQKFNVAVPAKLLAAVAHARPMSRELTRVDGDAHYARSRRARSAAS